jgi:hypothetical protein
MALQRKPVTKKSEPGYPDSQAYANDRRDFLIKLGIGAAGLLGLAGCEMPFASASKPVDAPIPIGAPPPVSNTATTPPVQPAQPVIAPPGVPPPQNLNAQQPTVTPQACTPGKPSASLNSTVQIPAQPQAYSKGDSVRPVPDVRPRATTGGEPVAPEMVKPQAASPGGAPLPADK